MVGENFEIYSYEMTDNAPKAFSMIGENFDICPSEMVENGPIIIHHSWKKFLYLTFSHD